MVSVKHCYWWIDGSGHFHRPTNKGAISIASRTPAAASDGGGDITTTTTTIIIIIITTTMTQ